METLVEGRVVVKLLVESRRVKLLVESRVVKLLVESRVVKTLAESRRVKTLLIAMANVGGGFLASSGS